MQFGRVPPGEDFSFELPDIDVRSVVPTDVNASPLIRIGAPTWSNPVWKGLIYPEDVARSEFLKIYSKTYATIEMNSTFYALPRQENIQRWVAETPADFRFAPKVPKSISHNLGSREMRTNLVEFLNTIEKLDGRLGPILFQLPPHFDFGFFSQLKEALAIIPNSMRVSVEFRHSSWFFHNMLVPPVFQYLQKHGMNALILDVINHRELVHTSLTSPFQVVRWMGRSGHPTDSTRLHQWTAQLQKFLDRGVKEVYFFLHQEQDEIVPWALSEFGQSLKLHEIPTSRFWQAGQSVSQTKVEDPQLSLGNLL